MAALRNYAKILQRGCLHITVACCATNPGPADTVNTLTSCRLPALRCSLHCLQRRQSLISLEIVKKNLVVVTVIHNEEKEIQSIQIN